MVKDIQDLVDEMKAQIGYMILGDASDAIDNLVNKIENTWVKISSDDLVDYSQDASKSKDCLNDAIDSFKNDKAVSSEITKLYADNPFINIDQELGIEDGNLSYEVTGSAKTFKDFLDGFKQTSLYKNMHECDNTFEIDTTNMDTTEYESEDKPTITVWVNPWSHSLSKISVDYEDDESKSSLEILTQYNKDFTITAPTEYISLTDLQSYIEELMQSFYSQSYSDYDTEPIIYDI